MKKHSQKAKKIMGRLEGLGYFNTTDLNAIGQAFYDTFESEDVTAGQVVDHVGAEWPEGTDADEMNAKIDLDDFFWKSEAGAVLVRELADKGFKIVKDR